MITFLMAGNYQDHVTSTLRKHTVHSSFLDFTFNKCSRNLHSVLFVQVMIGVEGNLLYVIRYPTEDDLADKVLPNLLSKFSLTQYWGKQHLTQVEEYYPNP